MRMITATHVSLTAADPPAGPGNWRLLTVSKSDSFVNISMFWPPLPDPSSIDFFPFTFIWISQDRNLWNYSAQSRPRFYISLETPTRNITIGPVQDKESWTAPRCAAMRQTGEKTRTENYLVFSWQSDVYIWRQNTFIHYFAHQYNKYEAVRMKWTKTKPRIGTIGKYALLHIHSVRQPLKL